MKKIIACISLVCAMSAGVTAMAATTATQSGKDSVSVTDASTYKTVLITEKDNDKNIVYVDQNDSGFASEAANFLIKADAEYGEYTIKMGGASELFSKNITLAPTAENTTTMGEPVATSKTTIDGENKTTYAYKIDENTSLSGYSKIMIKATKTSDNKEGSVYVDMPTVSGEAYTTLGVKVTDVPDGYTIVVSLVK